MNLKLLFCPGFLLLLVVSQNQAGARSISSLQSLPKLLDEDPEQAPGSEERPHEQDELVPAGVFAQQGTELQGLHDSREQPQGSGAVRRFLGHLLSLSRRHRGRSKKGLSRGCFGVRLDRIGSLSGLGC